MDKLTPKQKGKRENNYEKNITKRAKQIRVNQNKSEFIKVYQNKSE